jgi:cytochrome c553
MSKWTRSGIAAAMFGFAVAVLGCTEKEKTQSVAPPAGGRESAMPNQQQPGGGGAPEGAKAIDESEPFAAGKKVYNASKCSNCHTVVASEKSKAPNLSAVGKSHDAAWLAAHVKNPKAHEPMSKMPAFDKLSDAELKAVGEFLASLK